MRSAAHVTVVGRRERIWALGLAATQPVGLREMFGSMAKSFHPGRAAQNGLTAALLASQDFTSADTSIEGQAGWAHVLSTEVHYGEITDGLGQVQRVRGSRDRDHRRRGWTETVHGRVGEKS